ncbi:hypothetical protein GCM10011396_10320 [Undibacterium terreum]|uniref:PIN domain-containing protein n=2 Tax=Undibacterium terreum TaxID=1224302 RepID=A0A916U998_9BURK|nr:hypothetical protein GCM10011396_10320 [Undibacterium terreum]
MLDTNVFNRVLDEKIDITVFNEHEVFATHIQHDEILKTKNENRREALLKVFAEMINVQIPTSSAVAGVSVAGGACASADAILPTETAAWGTSNWRGAKWSKNDGSFEDMRRDLDALNKGKNNNTQDILIAETAFRNDLILVSSDVDLCKVMDKHGGQSVSPEDI